MSTIGFTNRERLMISDDKSQFLEYLAHKLPPSDYGQSDVEQWKVGKGYAEKQMRKNNQYFPTEESAD